MGIRVATRLLESFVVQSRPFVGSVRNIIGVIAVVAFEACHFALPGPHGYSCSDLCHILLTFSLRLASGVLKCLKDLPKRPAIPHVSSCFCRSHIRTPVSPQPYHSLHKRQSFIPRTAEYAATISPIWRADEHATSRDHELEPSPVS